MEALAIPCPYPRSEVEVDSLGACMVPLLSTAAAAFTMLWFFLGVGR